MQTRQKGHAAGEGQWVELVGFGFWVFGGLRSIGWCCCWGVATVNCSFGFGSTQLLPATMKSLQTNECVMAAGRVWEYKCVLVCVLASANCAIVFVSRVCVCVYMCVCVLVCTLVTPYRTSVRSQLKVAYRVHSWPLGALPALIII